MASFMHRPRIRIGLVAAATAGGAVLFLEVAHPARLIGSLGALPVSAAASAVGATMAGVMLVAVRWRTLLGARGIEAPTSRLFASLTIGSAVNNVLPARAGDAVRVESAHRHTGASRLAIAGSLVTERIFDAFVLAVLVVVGALCASAQGRFLWLGIAVGCAVLVAALVLVRLGQRLPASVAAGALATTFAIWFADVVMYGELARGFHLQLSFGALLLLVGAGNLALAIPGTAAGIGSFELVTLAGAHGIGVGGASLAAFVLAVHAVIVLPTTATGLLLFARRPLEIPRKGKEKGEPAASSP